MRPNISQLINNQKETEVQTEDYIKAIRGTTFKKDDSTKFMNIDSYQSYINPDEAGKTGVTKGFDFQSDYEKSRAINQSNWEQTGHVLAKVLPNTLLEAASMLGNVLDVEDYINSDNEIGNWLNTWAQEQKQNINDALPIYRENPNTALDIGDYAWWMQNGSSLVESAAAFVGLGYITGGASLGALINGGKALEWLNVISKGASLTDKAQKGIRFASGLMNTLMLNQAEGVGIGVSIFKTAYDQEKERLILEGKLSSSEIEAQATEYAAKRGARGIGYNRGNMLVNLTSSFAFLKTPALSRKLLSSPTISRSVKNTIFEGFNETIEESINLFSEKTALDTNYSIDKGLNALLTKEGAESAILGFVGGAGQTMLTNGGREIKLSRDNEGNRISRNQEQRVRYARQQEQIEKNNTILKEGKFADNTDAYFNAKEVEETYRDLVNSGLKLEQAKKDNNEADILKYNNEVESIKELLLTNRAYDAYSTGTTESLLNIHKEVLKFTPEQAEEKGLNKDTYKQKAQDAIDLITSLEREYNTSQRYANPVQIYENRAETFTLRKRGENLSRLQEDVKTELIKDLIDLGIKPETYTFDENGSIIFTNYNKYGDKKKEAIKNLANFKGYESLNKEIDLVNNRKEILTETYADLTSTVFQEKVKNAIKEERQRIKENKAKRKIAEKQIKNRNKKDKDIKKYKNSTKNTNSELNTNPTETETKLNSDNKYNISFSFLKADGSTNTAFEKQVNTFLNSEIEIDKKIIGLQNMVNTIQSKEDSNKVHFKGAVVQLNKAITELKKAKETEQAVNQNNEVAKEEINNSLEELNNEIGEDYAPVEENEKLNPEEEKVIKRLRLLNKVLDTMDNAGLDSKNFKTVANLIQNKIGKERFVNSFNLYKNLYNLTNRGESQVNDTYEDLFYTKTQKQAIIENDELLATNLVLSEIFNMSNTEFELMQKDLLSTFMEEQGYTVYSKDKLTVLGFKIKEGHNKIAHLDKLYKTNIKVKSIGFNILDFVTSKEDIDNELNKNISHTLLDYNKFGEGSEITFKVLDQQTYDNGTIVYADGRIEKNGVITRQDAIDVAPIALLFNGELLEGAFLHTTNWINENNIANPAQVQKQKEFLTTIRKKILESPTPIKTTIRKRTNGWLLVDANNEYGTVQDRLEKSQLGVGKDGQVFIQDGVTIPVENSSIIDGTPYSIVQVNKNSYYAIPIKPDTLDKYPQYINSILTAVKLYLNNDVSDPIVRQIEEATNINITTEKGLEAYISKFIYLNQAIDKEATTRDSFKTDEFLDLIRKMPEDKSFMRFNTNTENKTIEFGRGKNMGNSIGFIHREELNKLPIDKRKEAIDFYIKKLDNVLSNNMHITVNKNNFGKDNILPVIEEDEVSLKKELYDTFIKRHTTTKNYSYTLDTGTTIYAIQPNLEFDASFAFKQEVIEDANEDNQISENDLNNDGLNLNIDSLLGGQIEEDLAPKELTKEEEQSFIDTIPNVLFVKGINLNLQDTLIHYLSAQIVRDFTNKIEKPLKTLDKYEQFTLPKLIQDYKDALPNLEGTIKTKVETGITSLENLKNEFPKIKVLVLDNLRRYNNLKLKGSKFEAIKRELENNEEIELNLLTNELTSNKWEDDSAFRTDIKKKTSVEVKNYFDYINDIKDFKIVNGKRIPNYKIGALNLPIPIMFDRVINELSGILAYSNYDNTNTVVEPTLESMLNILEEWVETKPYLHEVIERLKNGDENIQNQFVSLMSKHYTHHILLFKKQNGQIYVNDSDNNTIVNTIQNRWLNNIFESKILINNEDGLIVDKDNLKEINESVKTFIAKIKSGENSTIIADAEKVFKSLGFNFSRKALKVINEGKIQIDGVPQSFLSLLSNKEGAFKVYLNRLNTIKGKNINENPLFYNNSALNKFTRQFAKLYPTYFANSFKDVRGRSYYGYSPNKFIIDRVKELKTNEDLLNKLNKQPFSATSHWVQQLLYNPLFKKHFNYYTFDGLALQNKKGKKLTTMSFAEIEQIKLNLFYKNNYKNKEDSNYLVNLFYPTTSDKGIQYILKTLGKNWGEYVNSETGKLNEAAIDVLYDYIIKPEINRILDVQSNPNKYNLKRYKEGGTMFNFIPSLNDSNKIENLWVTSKESGERKLNENIINDANLQLKIKAELNTFIIKLVNNKIKVWSKYGFITKTPTQIYKKTGEVVETNRYDLKLDGQLYGKTRIKENAQKEAYNYVLNYLVANVNTYQTMITDPAFYWKSNHYKTVAKKLVKNKILETENIKRENILQYYTQDDWIQEHEDLFNNMGKRLGADVAPGTDIVDSPNNTFNLLEVADNERPALLTNYYKAVLGNNAENYIKNSALNTTDAQEFTTLSEHLYLMNKAGEITTKDMKDILKKEKNGMSLDTIDLKKVFNPFKPVYVNNIWHEGVEHRIYVKSSSFPLFKQLTKGFEIDKLRVAMEQQKVDRIAFSSAIKVGNVLNAEEIYDKEEAKKGNYGVIKNNLVFNTALTMKTLPRKGFKIQQDNPYNENKTTINDGSQQRMLLTSLIRKITGFKLPNSNSSYTGQEIQNKLEEAYKEVYEIKYNKLIKELEFDFNTGKANIKKLQKILIDEGLTRNYPLYDIEALNLTKTENGELDFLVPLWLTSVSGKIEAMLNSIIDNRIRKIKPKGNSYVLGTSTGFKPILEGDAASKYVAKQSGIIKNKEWEDRGDGQLLPMRIVDNKGILYGEKDFDATTSKVLPAEIMIPFRFKDNNGNILNVTDFIDNNGNIDISKIDENLLELFGFRIPTQGLNSMAYVKIVGFLPEKSGDLLLAPADWVTQMGSDFDVDKLYTNSYNTTYKDNKLIRYNENNREKLLQDTILDLHFSILSNPSIDVQKEILKPLDFGKLGQMANEIYPLIKGVETGVGITEEYQTVKYVNARAGKGGIGVFSTDSIFLAAMQGTDIKLTKKVGKILFDYTFSLGGEKSNELNILETNNNSGRTKSEIIAAFQSLSVDDQNEQGMHKLNINTHTFDAIRTLLLSGFEEDVITYFLNQPIIRRYVELLTLANDDATKFKKEDIEDVLSREYSSTDKDLLSEADFLLNYGQPTLEQLKIQIEDKSLINNNMQQAILERFKELTSYGKTIQAVQSTINTASAGLGKDLFYATEKEQQLLNLDKNNQIEGTRDLIGEYLTLETTNKDLGNSVIANLIYEWNRVDISAQEKKEIIEEVKNLGFIPVTQIQNKKEYNKTITFIKPATIAGFASVYGLLFNNRIWEDFFPYSNPNIVKTIKDIRVLIGREQGAIKDKAEISKTIFNNLKSYFFTKDISKYTDGINKKERERLLLDTKENKSIATIVKYLRENNLLNNALINRLEFNIKKGEEPSNIMYNSSVEENLNERAIYAAFSYMLTDNTQLKEFNGEMYTPKKVAQDLITQQLLTGGIQKANQFIKYIPINYLYAIGFYKSITDINFNNEEDFNSINFKFQYAQHNPRYFELNEVIINDIKKGGNYKYYNNGTIIRKVNKEALHLNSLISIPNKNATKGYDLYVYNSNSKQWEQIDTLGQKDIFEYNANIKFNNSVIKNNKIPVVTNYTLPTDEKGIKEVLSIDGADKDNTGVVFSPNTNSISDYYHLETEDTSMGKMSTILTTIIDDKRNSFNSFMAQEVFNNLDKLKGYNFIVTTNLNAQGRHKLIDKTIEVNPNQIKTKEAFAKVVLEEMIHALTKEAIIKNESNIVKRLHELRGVAEQTVRKHFGAGANSKFKQLAKKVKEGIALNKDEVDLIYPVYNTEEFVGRLFKSKRLQNLLNDTPTNIEGVSFLQKMWDIVKDLLAIVGIDIKKGSALEYALVDTISLINHSPVSSEIQGEIKKAQKINRTLDFINDRFKLITEDGNKAPFTKKIANELVGFIEKEINNIVARIEPHFEIKGKYQVNIIYKKDLDLFNNADYALAEDNDTGANSKLLKSYNDRINRLELTLDKAEQNDDFERITILKEQVADLIERRNEILGEDKLSQFLERGKQDMQELAEIFNRSISMEDTLYIRKVIHFWQSAKDNMFTEDALASTLAEEYDKIANEALKFETKLRKIEEDYMNKFMKDYGADVTVKELFNYFKDINGLSSMVLDISRSGNALLDSVFLSVKHANIDAIDETNEILQDLNTKEKAVRRVLNSLGFKGFEPFRQETKNGNITGHLVSKYTNEFEREKRTVLKELRENNIYSNYVDVLNWARNNTKQINLQYLFPIKPLTGAHIQAAENYKKKLKEELGKETYDTFIKEQGKLIDRYNKLKDNYLKWLYGQTGLASLEDLERDVDSKKRFIAWKQTNSPYAYINHIQGKNLETINGYSNFHNVNLIYNIPSKAEHYDNNFKIIENNKDLLDFYNYYVDIDKKLKQFMPSETRTQLAFNGIPFIKKTLLEEYSDKGMKVGLAPIWDGIKRSVRTDEEGNITYKNIDPITEVEEKKLGLNLTVNNYKEYKDFISTKKIEHKLATGEDASIEQINTWSEEIINTLSQEKSYDLAKVLKVYALTVLAYKHKVRVEDNIRLAQNILSQQKEVNRNSKGEPLLENDISNSISKKSEATSFVNLKKQLDYFVQVFYGKTKVDEGVSKKKVYTNEEKRKIKNYEDLKLKAKVSKDSNIITDIEYNNTISDLDTKIEELGKVAVWSKRGDAILKYQQILGMGWNVMGAIANMGFGRIANMIEGAGGQLYNIKQLKEGYKLTSHSIAKNATFNKVQTDTAKKIRAMMNKWDVLKDATHELFENPLNIELSKGKKWLSPYNLIQRTEYINQAPVMIAMMLNTKVDTPKGEINLWEGYDSNGNWKTEYGEEPKKISEDLRISLDQVIKMNHGNYDPNSPLSIKNKFLGRALSQFRTWIFENFAARFESEKPDAALGLIRKGRYRSVGTFFQTAGLKGTIDVLKGLLKNISYGTMFKSADFESYVDGKSFKEVDAANMRKVMVETLYYIGIYGALSVMSMIAEGLDDEEDVNKKYALNLLMNQGLRLKTDIIFYLHPGELRNLMRDAIPATSLIKDSIKWLGAVHDLVIGEDNIEAGVYSGSSGIIKASAKLVPLTSQPYRIYNYTIQSFDKN